LVAVDQEIKAAAAVMASAVVLAAAVTTQDLSCTLAALDCSQANRDCQAHRTGLVALVEAHKELQMNLTLAAVAVALVDLASLW
jgi:hypothetical protein